MSHANTQRRRERDPGPRGVAFEDDVGRVSSISAYEGDARQDAPSEHEHDPNPARTIVPINTRTAPGSVMTKRLNINLPASVFNELEELARSTGRTMTDVVRNALGLIAVAINEERQGNRLVVARSDGRAIKEIVLPK